MPLSRVVNNKSLPARRSSYSSGLHDGNVFLAYLILQLVDCNSPDVTISDPATSSVIQPLLVSNSIYFTPTFTPSAQISVHNFDLLVKSERLILILPLIGRKSVEFEIVPFCGLAYHFKAIPQAR